MTQNRRIILNILATYGRSLFALFVGVFTARWVLSSLGAESFGMFSVVGGLIAFVTFLNSTLAGANSRFYAVAVGAARAAEDKELALEECRKWFNTALSIHMLLPVVLILVGYAAGAWVISNFLVVPEGRLTDCLYIYRLSCLSCFIAMVNVPFQAMYTAKQEIAELTIYSYLSTLSNFVFCYYMTSHPGEWFVDYAKWCCVLSIVPQLLICVRALVAFPECKIMPQYMFDINRFKQLGRYSGWQMLGGFCGLLRTQGLSILINKIYGPRVNAAMAISNSINTNSSTLSAALLGAFSPAIVTSWGAREFDKMKELGYRASKFGVLLSLIFVIPLSLELEYILNLWLKTPPEYTRGLCLCILAAYIVDIASNGQMVAVHATGNIKKYQIVLSSICVLTLPLATVVGLLGFGVYSVGLSYLVMVTVNSFGRVVFARRIVNMSFWKWISETIIPMAIASLTAIVVVKTLHEMIEPSFIRLIATCILSEVVIISLSWLLLLTNDEKSYIKNYLNVIIHKKGMYETHDQKYSE